MNLKIPLRAAVAFCLAGCASVVPQFSDYVYSADLGASDPNSVEVRVTHGAGRKRRGRGRMDWPRRIPGRSRALRIDG